MILGNKYSKTHLSTNRNILSITFALMALFMPATSYASSLGDYGVIIAWMFVGIPSAALLLILIIVSIIMGLRRNKSRGNRMYGIIVIVVSVLVPFPYLILGMFWGGEPGILAALKDGKVLLFILLLWLPTLVLSAISTLLANWVKLRS